MSDFAAASAFIGSLGISPKVVVVLGSGLGSVAEKLGSELPRALSQADVPGWPAPHVVGHSGKLLVYPSGLCVLAGRVHAYEGRPAEEVVRPLRTLIHAGAKMVVLTNAAGGIDPTFEAGELVLITDHLNLTGTSPLVGPHVEGSPFGPRFPDMSAAYSHRLRARAQAAAKRLGWAPLKQGVYAGMLGPAYETPAEVRMLATLGASLVGMSTVLETVAAHAMGAEVLGISSVANLAAGVSQAPLSHEEVLAGVALSANRLAGLIEEVVRGSL